MLCVGTLLRQNCVPVEVLGLREGEGYSEIDEEETVLMVVDHGSHTLMGPWGLRFTHALRGRQPPFLGTIILLSFESRFRLEKTPAGDILGSRGVVFLRLPVSGYDLERAITGAQPITRNEWEDAWETLSLWRFELKERISTLRHRGASALGVARAAGGNLVRLRGTLPEPALVERFLRGLREAWPLLSVSVRGYLNDVRDVVEQVRHCMPELDFVDSEELCNRTLQNIEQLARWAPHDTADWRGTFEELVDIAGIVQRDLGVLHSMLEQAGDALKLIQPTPAGGRNVKDNGKR